MQLQAQNSKVKPKFRSKSIMPIAEAPDWANYYSYSEKLDTAYDHFLKGEVGYEQCASICHELLLKLDLHLFHQIFCHDLLSKILSCFGTIKECRHAK